MKPNTPQNGELATALDTKELRAEDPSSTKVTHAQHNTAPGQRKTPVEEPGKEGTLPFSDLSRVAAPPRRRHRHSVHKKKTIKAPPGVADQRKQAAGDMRKEWGG
eukprot:RCo055717